MPLQPRGSASIPCIARRAASGWRRRVAPDSFRRAAAQTGHRQRCTRQMRGKRAARSRSPRTWRSSARCRWRANASRKTNSVQAPGAGSASAVIASHAALMRPGCPSSRRRAAVTALASPMASRISSSFPTKSPAGSKYGAKPARRRRTYPSAWRHVRKHQSARAIRSGPRRYLHRPLLQGAAYLHAPDQHLLARQLPAGGNPVADEQAPKLPHHLLVQVAHDNRPDHGAPRSWRIRGGE